MGLCIVRDRTIPCSHACSYVGKLNNELDFIIKHLKWTLPSVISILLSGLDSHTLGR